MASDGPGADEETQSDTFENAPKSSMQPSAASSDSRQATLDDAPQLARPPSRSRPRSISPSKTLSGRQSPVKALHGFTGDLPVVSSPPPPSTAERVHAMEARNIVDKPSQSASPSAPTGGAARKASSGFAGFLGRMGTMRRTAISPPAPRADGRFTAERRNTGASTVSLDSNAPSLAAIADELGHPSKAARLSLQDQFQHLRRQEEYHFDGTDGQAADGDEESESMARTTSDAGLPSPTATDSSGKTRFGRANSIPSLMKSPPLNPSLPPGTASGLSAGPSDEPIPVNWDLWQSVVYEGPAAVARTSGEQLNRAIASGIPPAIRGVVWQVLAESKNEELENIYRALKARGTAEAESPAMGNGNVAEKESVTSSRSSVHSDTSTPAISTMISPPASVEGSGSAELQAKLLAEKQKRDAAALNKLEKAIKRDLGSRTSYSKYTQSAGLQDGLFGVCKAYALFDEGVGYAQGINFIAMPLLFNTGEEEAFTLLVRLMTKYDLRSMFTTDMPGLHLRLYQFERLLEDYEPALYCHLKRRNVGPQLYATQWFLTLFAHRFPLQLVLRVYDLIFTEGLTAILQFGIVLLQRNRVALLEMKDMSQLTTFLKEKIFDVYIDKSPSASSLLDSGFFGSVTGGADRELYRADEMVRDATEIKISDDTLARYTAEWEETQRAERERADELESLRTTAATLALRVKGLEDRTQEQDTEHVTIASDLVRIKVENEGLADENEGLKMQVLELQRMVDTQPAEVEQRLQEEMERIMQRNIEVQNANRAMREEMDEVEGELVKVKMSHAQTQADHDTLKQKWASVQAMLNDGT